MEPYEVIKEIRTRKGIPQRVIAGKVGLSQQAFALIEKGKRKMDTSLFFDILTAFDISSKEYENVIFSILQDKCKDFLYDLKQKDHALLWNFYELNALGQEEAIKRVHELTEIPRYTQKDDSTENSAQ